MIVRTLPYEESEIREIIRIRTSTENITLEDAALTKLTEVGKTSSLRYSLQLLAPAAVLANVMGRNSISVDDILQTQSLFLDARSSARNLSHGIMNPTDTQAMDVA